jgi:prepilin-type N-terminal cleavage/methylation domain-containing protein
MALAKYKSTNDRFDAGFSLIEVMVASAILTVAVLALAQLFALSTATNMSGRSTTYAAVLAEQKIEELRSLAWGFDSAGLPVTDTASDTTKADDSPIGGTGLTPSPAAALQENTPGYVDYVDRNGLKLGTGKEPPGSAVYTRRWSIEPLPTNPNNTVIIQVLVTRHKNRGDADKGKVRRLIDEARVITVKTRKAQ